jgi:hypothetical protein
MYKTTLLTNGDKWKTASKASNEDLFSGQMALISPSCHVAGVAKV